MFLSTFIRPFTVYAGFIGPIDVTMTMTMSPLFAVVVDGAFTLWKFSVVATALLQAHLLTVCNIFCRWGSHAEFEWRDILSPAKDNVGCLVRRYDTLVGGGNPKTRASGCGAGTSGVR